MMALKDDQWRVAQDYKDGLYRTINDLMRHPKRYGGMKGPTGQTYLPQIRAMKRATKVDRKTGTTWRGVNLKDFTYNVRGKLERGEPFGDPGFFSTSVDEDFSRRWVGGHPGAVLFELELDNQPCLDMVRRGMNEFEGEIILPSNTRFVSTGKRVERGMTYYSLKVVKTSK
jgi:hypothetical protein